MKLVEELTRRLRLRGQDNGCSAASSTVFVAHLRAFLAKLTLRLKQFRKQVRPNYFNEFWLGLHAIAGRAARGGGAPARVERNRKCEIRKMICVTEDITETNEKEKFQN